MRAASQSLYHLLLYLFLSLLLIFLDRGGFFSPARSVVQGLTVPAKQALFDLRQTFYYPLASVSGKIGDGGRILQLEERVAQLSSELAGLRALEEENRELRRLLGAPLPPSWKFAPARVISGTQDSLTLLSDYAPSPGTPVVAVEERGALLGRVREVRGKEIRVLLVTHPDSKIPALVRDLQGLRVASGIVTGEGGVAVLDQVLTGEALAQGYFVLTSGEAGLPPELLIGTVEEVLPQEGEAWKRAKLKTAGRLPDFVFFVTEY